MVIKHMDKSKSMVVPLPPWMGQIVLSPSLPSLPSLSFLFLPFPVQKALLSISKQAWPKYDHVL